MLLHSYQDFWPAQGEHEPRLARPLTSIAVHVNKKAVYTTLGISLIMDTIYCEFYDVGSNRNH